MKVIYYNTHTGSKLTYYVLQALVVYENYKGLYTLEREQVLAEFQSNNPHLSEFESEMERYEKIENEINQLPAQQSLTAAIQLSNGISISRY